MLELVEVDLTGRQGRVDLRVLREVDEFDLDTLGRGGLGVEGPVRVAGSDDTDLDGVTVGAGGGSVGSSGAAGKQGDQRDDGEGGEYVLFFSR